MVEMNVNEMSEMEWASPILILMNNEGSIRFRVYHRKLNAMESYDW